MIMKQNITNFGGGSKTYLRPAFPGGNAKPFNQWGDQMLDAYGDPIEE